MRLTTGGHLGYYLPGRRPALVMHLDAPTQLLEILERVGIPRAEVHLVAVNGVQAELETAVVNDEDSVRILSAADGG